MADIVIHSVTIPADCHFCPAGPKSIGTAVGWIDSLYTGYGVSVCRVCMIEIKKAIEEFLYGQS